MSWAVETELTGGVSATHFGRSVVVIRLEAVVALYRLESAPDPVVE
ncbi:MAG: hypothetical protein RIB98_14760 [Acidimicrobiales bacterium]